MQKSTARIRAPVTQASVLLVMLTAFSEAAFASYQVDQLAPRPEARSGRVGDYFALSGDTAAVGVLPSDSEASPRAGGLLIYQRFGGRWYRQAELLEGTGRESYFGRIALEGDVLVTQLRGTRVLDAREPLLSIHERENGSFVRRHTLTLKGRLEALDMDGGVIVAIDNTSAEHELNIIVRRSHQWVIDTVLPVGNAFTVAIDGDTIVAGDEYGGKAGTAYVIERINGTWQRTQQVWPPRGRSFGESVAVDGDYIVVGDTTRQPSMRTGKGTAYLFTKIAGRWGSRLELQPDNARDNENFGASVAVEDGIALVGAPGDGIGAPGSVYKFELDRGEWVETERFVPAAADAGDLVGTSLALDGHTAMIGAPGHDDQASDSGAVHAFWLVHGSRERLTCPADVDLDGVPDFALTAGEGTIVRNLNSELVHAFPIAFPDGRRGLIDLEVMPDSNADGAPELGILTRNPLQAQIHDPFSDNPAEPLSVTSYDAPFEPFDLEFVPDMTGDGVVELAVLAGNPPRVRISDGRTGETLRDVAFSGWIYGQDLEVYPDLDHDGRHELAVLGEHREHDRSDKVEIRNFEGRVVQEFWPGRGWRVLEQTLIADINGNGYPEVAVRRSQNEVDVPPDGPVVPERNAVVLRDIMTGEHLRMIDEGQPTFPTEQFLAITDINGNGADEIVLLGRREGFGVQKVRVIDSRTGRYLRVMFFDRDAAAQNLIACADVNGNGAPELVLLGRGIRDGNVKAILRDARTGKRLNAVNWP